MPDARVAHAHDRLVADHRARRRRSHPPTGVNLTALVSRFTTTCLSLISSAHTSPTSSATVQRDRQPLPRRALAHQREPLLEQRRQREQRGLELHPPRLDLGQVEDLVDQLEQVLPGVADVADVLLLALVELAEHPLQQHVAEPDDGVQRRPQLVRHRGQELGLVPARRSPARARSGRSGSRSRPGWRRCPRARSCGRRTARSSCATARSRRARAPRPASARRASCGSRRARARAPACSPGPTRASWICTVRRSASTRPTSSPEPAASGTSVM